MSTVIPLRPGSHDEATLNELVLIREALDECRQTLHCALRTLSVAEDEGAFGAAETADASTALRVAERAHDRLRDLLERLEGATTRLQTARGAS